MKQILKNIFLFALIFQTAFLLNALTADQIAKALDSSSEIEFSAPGNYYGNNNAWAIGNATGKAAGTNIPIDMTNVGNRETGAQGYLSAIGYTCLYGAIPTTRMGKAGSYDNRARNFFTVTVKGDGMLSFDYRTSLDVGLDASLWIYEYSGNNAQATIVPSATFTQPNLSRLWAKKTENYDLWDDNFWESYSINVTSKKSYTHTITFAIVGNAQTSSTGGSLSSAATSTDVLENRVYLDCFAWESDDIPLFELSEKDTYFTGTLKVTISSDYNDGVFTYYYTLDGTEPTVDSSKYDSSNGINISKTCTLKVHAYENATKSFAGETVSSAYTYSTGPTIAAPTYTVDSKNFDGKTTVTIKPSTASNTTSYYSRQGSKGKAFSNNMSFDYDNKDIVNVDIIHLKAFSPYQEATSCEFSDTVKVQLSKTATPTLRWKIDGKESTETKFTESVEIINDDGLLYLDPANGKLTDSGTIRAVAVQDGKIASNIVSQSFTKYTQVEAPTYTVDSKNLNGKTTISLYPSTTSNTTSYYKLTGKSETAFSKKTDLVFENADIAGKEIMSLVAYSPSKDASNKYVSETVTVKLSRTATPTLSWKIDGVASTDTWFKSSVEIVKSASNLILDPSSGKLTAAGTIRAVAVNEGEIASEIVSQKFNKYEKFTIAKEALYPSAEGNASWALYVMPGDMPQDDQGTFIDWLMPYTYDTTSRTYAKASSLEAGKVYLVYCPSLDWTKVPTGLVYGPNLPEATAQGWQLVREKSSYTLGNGQWVVSPNQSVPGWKKD